MFNLGFTEIFVIAALALIFIGPKELPAVARTVARLLNELKRATGDISSTIAKTKEDANGFVKDSFKEVTDSLDASLDDINLEEKSKEAAEKSDV